MPQKEEKRGAVIVQPHLKEFVRQQMKRRGWNQQQVMQASNGLIKSHNSVLRATSDDQFVSYQVVSGLAEAFKRPLQNMLVLAELLPAEPEHTQESRRLMEIFESLDDARRQDLLWYAEGLRDRTASG